VFSTTSVYTDKLLPMLYVKTEGHIFYVEIHVTKYLSWRSWIGWSPLLWLVAFYSSLYGTCHIFSWHQCIGRYAPPEATTYFWCSKLIVIGLLISTLIVGVSRKLNWVGWLGWSVSVIPALYHFAIFID